MTPFPWEAAMRFGFGVLRLDPRSFWSMSPRELAAAWSALAGDRAPLPRGELESLMERFPDGR
jgi:uncharacterized phage protein (TIGR02216 family)